MSATINVATMRYPHVEALFTEQITLSDGAFVQVQEVPGPLKLEELPRFDAWEMPLIRYMAARELGFEWTAIPVFPIRRFVQWMVEVAENSEIQDPSDLNGKRIAQRYYGWTDGVWAKGVLEEDYGVDLSSVTWFTDRKEMLAGTAVPDFVVCLEGADPNELLIDGVVDVSFSDGYGQPPAPGVRRLWADPERAAAEWYASSGCFPILHVIAARDSALTAHPSLAAELYQAFDRAKNDALVRWDYGAALPDDLRAVAMRSGFPGSSWGGSDRSFLAPDPIPYGFAVEANRATIQRAIRYAYGQRAIQQSHSIEELFAFAGT